MAATRSSILTNVSVHTEARHSRDLSTISTATAHTNNTAHSQPTEPLLSPTTPQAGHHHDVSSHRSRNSERSLGLPGWSQSHVMNRRHSAAIVSEKGFRNPLKRVKSLLWIKNGLVVLMGTFSSYLCCCLGMDSFHPHCQPFQLLFVFASIKRCLTIAIFSALGHLWYHPVPRGFLDLCLGYWASSFPCLGRDYRAFIRIDMLCHHSRPCPTTSTCSRIPSTIPLSHALGPTVFGFMLFTQPKYC